MKSPHKFLPLIALFSFNVLAQSIPAISKGIEYPAYRKSLIKEGWIPDKQTKECGFNCQGQRRDGFIETEDCGEAGLAPCTFIFKNKESIVLKVHTAGENLVVQKTAGGGVSSSSIVAPAQPVKPSRATESRPQANSLIDTSSRAASLGSCSGVMRSAAPKANDGAMRARLMEYSQNYLDSASRLPGGQYQVFNSVEIQTYNKAERSNRPDVDSAIMKCVNSVR